MRIFPSQLITEDGLVSQYRLRDYFLSVTEVYWSLVPPSVPFTRREEHPLLTEKHVSTLVSFAEMPSPPIDFTMKSAEEDALIATAFVADHISESTLLHEMGCWNGENIARMLYYFQLQGKQPSYCLGTDVNQVALNLAESTLNYLGVRSPDVQFHLGNAQKPVDFTSLDLAYEKEVKVGLRVIPVLEPQDAKRMLQAIHRSFRSPDSVLVLSYPTLTGTSFEMNSRRASEEAAFYREDFHGGVVFRTPFQHPKILPLYLKESINRNMVINTYYSPEGFESLTKDCGFKVLQSVRVGDYSDNDRVVVVLKAS